MKMARHCTVSFFVTALVAGCASLAGGTEDSNPAPVPDAKAGKPLDPTDELERILHDITVVNFKHHRLETELRDVKKRLTTIEAQAFPREDRKNECSGNVPGIQRLEEEKEALKKALLRTQIDFVRLRRQIIEDQLRLIETDDGENPEDPDDVPRPFPDGGATEKAQSPQDPVESGGGK